MATPLIIGGIVLGGIFAALSDDDENDSEIDSDDDDYYESAAVRRAEAERKRAKEERKKQIKAAHENFLSRGESIGLDIANSLHGWVDITTTKSPTFAAKLTTEGYKLTAPAVDEQCILDLLLNNNLQPNEIHKNLITYSSAYAVNLAKGPKLLSIGSELQAINSELEELLRAKEELYRLKKIILAQE